MSKPPTSAFGRVMARTVWTEGGCLEFTGSCDAKGYGRVSERGWKAPPKVHRVVWRHFYGDIPDGIAVLHRCDNPSCVNVFHLFLGTILDNNRDMVAKGRHHNQLRTHCRKGHAFAEHGTVVFTRGRPARSCRLCHAIACRAYRTRKAAVV